jgi:hypothetical protein
MAGDAVSRSDALDARLKDEQEAIAALVQHDRRNRRMIRWLIVSVALDVMLSLGLGLVAIQASIAAGEARSASSQAAQNASTARATCIASNQARAVQVQLWNYILDLPPASPSSPNQDAQRAQLRAYVNSTFAQRKC